MIGMHMPDSASKYAYTYHQDSTVLTCVAWVGEGSVCTRARISTLLRPSNKSTLIKFGQVFHVELSTGLSAAQNRAE